MAFRYLVSTTIPVLRYSDAVKGKFSGIRSLRTLLASSEPQVRWIRSGWCCRESPCGSKQPRVVLRDHYYRVALGSLVPSDQGVIVKNLVMGGGLVDHDGCPHVAHRDRVAGGCNRDKGIRRNLSHHHPLIAGRSPRGLSPSRAKRSIGLSWVVPWMRKSATVTHHVSSQSLSSSQEEKRRPARALRLTYLTPLSVFPLV